MAEIPPLPALQSAEFPYSGYYAASNGPPKDPTSSLDDATELGDTNDSDYLDIDELDENFTSSQQHNSHMEKSTVEFDTHSDSVTANTNHGHWLTPDSSRNESMEAQTLEEGGMVDSITAGQPWAGPWNAMTMDEMNESVPGVVTAPLGSTSDHVPTQNPSTSIVLTLPVRNSIEKPTASEQGTSPSKKSNAKGSAARSRKSPLLMPHQVNPQTGVVYDCIAPTNSQVAPQTIHHAPFQGVRQSVTQGTQQFSRGFGQIVPVTTTMAYHQAIRQLHTQGVPSTMPQTSMQMPSQFVRKSPSMTMPTPFGGSYMSQSVPPVKSQKNIHKIGPMDNSRPAKRRARDPHANFSPPSTQLEKARRRIAQLIAERDNITGVNPHTGTNYVEGLGFQGRILQSQGSLQAQSNDNGQSHAIAVHESYQDKYRRLLNENEALSRAFYAAEVEGCLWRERCLEISAQLHPRNELNPRDEA
ncbi:uncharacterized protein N7511_005381 [Penicillium nucicola]|uniref:uncharacterized protein n=1 Tax=Penicillium nucicola TaxID=1850975 RepID=UPI00254579AF|nr:uncharacterized protein N7511_005381 [Penicillium nucicola]KAJ5761999.1 hypothetical protein N7511_005381 [Penicillium nucicola]